MSTCGECAHFADGKCWYGVEGASEEYSSCLEFEQLRISITGDVWMCITQILALAELDAAARATMRLAKFNAAAAEHVWALLHDRVMNNEHHNPVVVLGSDWMVCTHEPELAMALRPGPLSKHVQNELRRVGRGE